MQNPNNFDLDFDLLCHLAQQSWLDRGQSMASAGMAMEYAKSELGLDDEYAVAALSQNEQSGETDA